MPSSLADLLNLELAWKRVKFNAAERAFVRVPNELKLIELEITSWLDSLRNNIQNGTYHPQPAIICDIPKPKGAIRPAAYIKPVDRIVYAACVSACYSYIYKAVDWTSEIADFSHPLANNPEKTAWILNQFNLWRDFAEKSIKKIHEGASHIIIADIAGCYENIDIATLASDLRDVGAPSEPIKQLSECLNRWAQATGGAYLKDIVAQIF